MGIGDIIPNGHERYLSFTLVQYRSYFMDEIATPFMHVETFFTIHSKKVLLWHNYYCGTPKGSTYLIPIKIFSSDIPTQQGLLRN